MQFNLIPKFVKNFVVANPLLVAPLKPKLNFVVIPDKKQRTRSRMRKLKRDSRDIDFAIFGRRKIAIMLTYLGHDFDGLASQATTKNTIEEHLYSTLEKTRLCENRKALASSKAGRTDKGVSAFRQVYGLTVRSNLREGPGVFWPEGTQPSETRQYSSAELNYSQMLNANLPGDISVLAVAHLPSEQEFSARFHCTGRVYKYFMPQANLDLEAMREGVKLLIGEKDFRNFCSIDKTESRLTTNYVRRIDDITLKPFGWQLPQGESTSSSNPYQMLELTIYGSSFLWHQIRFIVSILTEIGLRNEKPEVISELLDVTVNPSRPTYMAASELPLCLFDCSYEGMDLKWTFDEYSLNSTIRKFQQLFLDYQSRACMLRRMLWDLEPIAGADYSLTGLLANSRARRETYVPIMKRQRCASLEERIESVKEKKRAKMEQNSDKSMDE